MWSRVQTGSTPSRLRETLIGGMALHFVPRKEAPAVWINLPWVWVIEFERKEKPEEIDLPPG